MSLEQDLLAILSRLEGSAAVYLKDLNHGELFSLNPDRIFPAASTVKVPILAAVLRTVEKGRLRLDQKISVKAVNRVGGAGVLNELNPELRLTVQDFATLMIIQSDNTATNELIDLVGKESVNALIRELGLGSTVLQRKMMDQAAAAAGYENLTSARDLGMLLGFLPAGNVLTPWVSATMLRILKRQQLLDKLPALLPSGIIIANKTGELPGVEHDAGIFFLPNRTYVLVVLTADLADNSVGREIISQISHRVYQYLK